LVFVVKSSENVIDGTAVAPLKIGFEPVGDKKTGTSFQKPLHLLISNPG